MTIVTVPAILIQIFVSILVVFGCLFFLWLTAFFAGEALQAATKTFGLYDAFYKFLKQYVKEFEEKKRRAGIQ